MNDPTGRACSAYLDAVRDADGALDDALGHVRAEEAAGRITAVQAEAERVELLGRYVADCGQLRRELLGGSW